MSQESHEQKQIITNLQSAGEQLFDIAAEMQQKTDAEPKLDAIPLDDIRERAKAELHLKMEVTFDKMDQNADHDAWEKAGELSNLLFNNSKITPEIEAMQATLAILKDTLGENSVLYTEQSESLQQQLSNLQPSDQEVELNASIEHYGAAITIPSLAVRGISVVTQPPKISEEDVAVSDAQSENIEDARTDETESQSKVPKIKNQHARGTMRQTIINYVASKNGTVTREDLMEYLDSLAADPTAFTSDRTTRYGAYVTSLELKAEELGVEVIRQGKRGEVYTLTIRELHPTPEVSVRDIQEAYNQYAVLRTDRDHEVQGTISVVMLSEAILGILKNPKAWSRGKEDPYWLNHADRSLLCSYIEEACDLLPSELSLDERRAYAAAIVTQKIHQDPKWIENEFSVYEKANTYGQYNPIQNALAIMLKLQDMSLAERGDFIAKQLTVQPFISIGAEVSKKVAVITNVSHLPVRYARLEPTQGDADTVVFVEDVPVPVVSAKEEVTPKVVPELMPQSIVEMVVATALTTQVEVEPVVATAPNKTKDIVVKKSRAERAEDKLREEGFTKSVGEAIDRLKQVHLMDINPNGRDISLSTARQKMRFHGSNKFLTNEAVDRLQAAGIVGRRELNDLDSPVSRDLMVLSLVFNSHQERLSQKGFGEAALKIVKECIASFDKARQPASGK